MIEIWKDIKWYEWLYQISMSEWNIRSLRTGYIMSPYKSKTGHSYIWLLKDWKNKTLSISRIVGITCMGLNINDRKTYVCHKSEELIDWLLDNNINNLFLWTAKDNSQDMIKKWRDLKAKNRWKNNILSIKVNQYSLDWKFIKHWDSMSDIYRELWFNQTSISQCCSWLSHTAYKFLWRKVKDTVNVWQDLVIV
jgi:hypothetical protein